MPRTPRDEAAPPAAVIGRPRSLRRAITDALRAADGAPVSAAEIARILHGQADQRALNAVRSLINECRTGLRTSGYPAQIESLGQGYALSYAWRAGALAASAPPTVPGEDDPAGSRVRISLAGGVWFDGDRVVGADGTRWERARA